MERKNSRYVFLNKKHVFSGNMCFRMCFRMVALDSVLESCLRRVKDLRKTRSLDSVLESCLRRVRDLTKKHVPGKKTCIYSIYRIYYIHILYICYAENCVVDRDAAAAGQPSHPVIQELGPGAP